MSPSCYLASQVTAAQQQLHRSLVNPPVAGNSTFLVRHQSWAWRRKHVAICGVPGTKHSVDFMKRYSAKQDVAGGRRGLRFLSF